MDLSELAIPEVNHEIASFHDCNFPFEGRNSPSNSSHVYIPENHIEDSILDLIARWENPFNSNPVSCAGRVVMPADGNSSMDPPRKFKRTQKQSGQHQQATN